MNRDSWLAAALDTAHRSEDALVLSRDVLAAVPRFADFAMAAYFEKEAASRLREIRLAESLSETVARRRTPRRRVRAARRGGIRFLRSRLDTAWPGATPTRDSGSLHRYASSGGYGWDVPIRRVRDLWLTLGSVAVWTLTRVSRCVGVLVEAADHDRMNRAVILAARRRDRHRLA